MGVDIDGKLVAGRNMNSVSFDDKCEAIILLPKLLVKA